MRCVRIRHILNSLHVDLNIMAIISHVLIFPELRVLTILSALSGPEENFDTFFHFNSTEREIYPAHK